MFFRKISTDGFSNLIANGTDIIGTINFSGILKIQGNVHGDIVSQTTNDPKSEFALVVDKGGVVHSSIIKCPNAVIGGDINVNTIWVENTLRILKTAKIESATIYYRNLEIEPGAVIHNCQMKNLDFSSEGEEI